MCVYSFCPFLPRRAGPSVAGVSVTASVPPVGSRGCLRRVPAAVSWLILTTHYAMEPVGI